MRMNDLFARIAVRLELRFAIASLIVTLGVSGCASTVPPAQLAAFEPGADVISLFARNPIVCAPTAIGNAVGALAGGPLAFLFWPPGLLAATLTGGDDDLAFRIYGTAFWVPVLLAGGATGAIFLPMSYAIGEQPCDLGVSTGWKG